MFAGMIIRLGFLCTFHAHWAAKSGQPDPFYHRGVIEGRMLPTFDYLTEPEVRATMRGRAHGDGRRLDAYCADDQLEGDW